MHCETSKAYITHRAVAIGFQLTLSPHPSQASTVFVLAMLATHAVRLRQASARRNCVYHLYTSQRTDDSAVAREVTPQIEEVYGEDTADNT